MNSKSEIGYEAFARIIIMIVIISLVVKFGAKVAEASGISIFGGESVSGKSLNELSDKLNSPELREGTSKQEFVKLDGGTAIIGFGKDKDYECHSCIETKICPSCPTPSQLNVLTAKFKRPNANECKNQACLCLCSKGIKSSKGQNSYFDITCDKIKCKSLNLDISPEINIGASSDNPNNVVLNANWKGGFIYARDLPNNDDAIISGMPKNKEITRIVFNEKKNVNGIVYVALCPNINCVK